VNGAALSAERALHIVVRVGAESFAFPVSHVDEAVDAPAIEWVPTAPPGMLGQMMHRDRTVPAWDAGWAFGVERTGGAGAAIVLRDGPHRFALVVDDVADTARLELEGVRAAPAGTDVNGILSGVCFSSAARRSLVNVVRVESLMEWLKVQAADPAGGRR
jgi:chemotaxis signal transduction protein